MNSLSLYLLVIKRKNVVQLHVDTVDNYKIGPPFPTVPQPKQPLYVGGVPGECNLSVNLLISNSKTYNKTTATCWHIIHFNTISIFDINLWNPSPVLLQRRKCSRRSPSRRPSWDASRTWGSTRTPSPSRGSPMRSATSTSKSVQVEQVDLSHHYTNLGTTWSTVNHVQSVTKTENVFVCKNVHIMRSVCQWVWTWVCVCVCVWNKDTSSSWQFHSNCLFIRHFCIYSVTPNHEFISSQFVCFTVWFILCRQSNASDGSERATQHFKKKTTNYAFWCFIRLCFFFFMFDSNVYTLLQIIFTQLRDNSHVEFCILTGSVFTQFVPILLPFWIHFPFCIPSACMTMFCAAVYVSYTRKQHLLKCVEFVFMLKIDFTVA